MHTIIPPNSSATLIRKCGGELNEALIARACGRGEVIDICLAVLTPGCRHQRPRIETRPIERGIVRSGTFFHDRSTGVATLPKCKANRRPAADQRSKKVFIAHNISISRLPRPSFQSLQRGSSQLKHLQVADAKGSITSPNRCFSLECYCGGGFATLQ